jgi:hypothetical protein
LQDASTNFKALEDHLKQQRSVVTAGFIDLIGKLNTLSLAVDALASWVGYRQGFEDEAGVSSSFECLFYLQDVVAEVKSKLRSYDRVGTKVNNIEMIGAALDARTAKLEDEAPRVAGLDAEIKSIGTSVTVSFNSLKEKFVRPMLRLHSRLTVKDMSGADFMSLFALMETKVKRMADDADIFGSMGLPGPVEQLGMGGSNATLDTLLGRLEQVETENAKLQEAIDDMTRLGPKTAGPVLPTEGKPEGVVELLLERVATLEGRSGQSICITGYSFGGPGDCEYFLRTKLTWEEHATLYCND